MLPRGWDILFHRGLTQGDALSLASLRDLLPDDMRGVDSPSWRLTPSGSFSVRLAYRALFRGPLLPWTSPLFKAPISLKTKIFLWQLLRVHLPSWVEVAKRHGSGNGLCPLCAVPETTTHIMFSCPAAQFLWSFLHEALGLSGVPETTTHIMFSCPAAQFLWSFLHEALGLSGRPQPSVSSSKSMQTTPVRGGASSGYCSRP
jgi:hypothetical protein